MLFLSLSLASILGVLFILRLKKHHEYKEEMIPCSLVNV
jgi:hypothetical protein